MGTVRAQDVMLKAYTIVLDETNVRWPLAELCGWINDGQREIVLQKPSALSANIALQLVAGTYQTIPPAYSGLLRVVRNLQAMPATQTDARAGGRAIRVVSRDVLDSQSPEWHDETVTLPKSAVKHYLFDEQDPYHFYVYPPNDGTGVIEAILAAIPKAIAVSPDGADPLQITSYSQTLDLEDIYANAVLDYVLYRAYTKDASFAGNAQRAAFHYQQFANSIGMKVKLDVLLSPNTAAETKAS